MSRKLLVGVALLAMLLTPTFAHNFSSTFAEFHMDFGKSAEHYGDFHSAGRFTMTLEHFSSWNYGDNFFFIDVDSAKNFQFNTNEGGIYMEYAPRFSINRIAELGKWDSFITELFFTSQINYGYGVARFAEPEGFASFQIGPVFMFGASIDFNVPGFQVFSMHFLLRHEVRDGNDPLDGTHVPDDTGFQFTWVWDAKLFNLFEEKVEKDAPPSKAGEVHFRGFLDYWDRGAITNDRGTFLTEPQLVIHLTNELAIGTEIEISYNFAGAGKGVRHLEVDPTVFLRFDF